MSSYRYNVIVLRSVRTRSRCARDVFRRTITCSRRRARFINRFTRSATIDAFLVPFSPVVRERLVQVAESSRENRAHALYGAIGGPASSGPAEKETTRARKESRLRSGDRIECSLLFGDRNTPTTESGAPPR